MQIILNISKDDYTLLKHICEQNGMGYVFKNSTPLPKHGRLIDADALELDADWNDYYVEFGAYSEIQIKEAPTIIEAEGGDE